MSALVWLQDKEDQMHSLSPLAFVRQQSTLPHSNYIYFPTRNSCLSAHFQNCYSFFLGGGGIFFISQSVIGLCTIEFVTIPVDSFQKHAPSGGVSNLWRLESKNNWCRPPYIKLANQRSKHLCCTYLNPQKKKKKARKHRRKRTVLSEIKLQLTWLSWYKGQWDLALWWIRILNELCNQFSLLFFF